MSQALAKEEAKAKRVLIQAHRAKGRLDQALKHVHEDAQDTTEQLLEMTKEQLEAYKNAHTTCTTTLTDLIKKYKDNKDAEDHVETWESLILEEEDSFLASKLAYQGALSVHYHQASHHKRPDHPEPHKLLKKKFPVANNNRTVDH